MRSTLFWSACLLLARGAEPQSPPLLRIAQRSGEAVVIDGKISQEEWEGALGISVAPDATALVFQTDKDLLLAVRLTTPSPSYVDLFLLLDDGKRVNLHASMQVGERELPAEGWTDHKPPTHWGRQVHWRANAVKDAPDKKATTPVSEMFIPYEGFEFRLSKQRFGGRSLRLRVEVRDFTARRADLVFPAGSTRFDAKSWAELSLNP